MKNLILLVSVFLIAGCANEIVDAIPDYEQSKSAQVVEKKLKMINIVGSFYYEEATDGCEPFSMQAVISGEGNSTLMGKTNVYERYCVDEYGVPILFVEGYITAANGDRINTLAVDHWVDEETQTNYSKYVIIGGTGRFENAEGEIVNSTNIDWPNGTFTGEATGVIYINTNHIY